MPTSICSLCDFFENRNDEQGPASGVWEVRVSSQFFFRCFPEAVENDETKVDEGHVELITREIQTNFILPLFCTGRGGI